MSKKCAYCDLQLKLTNEHIIPAFLRKYRKEGTPIFNIAAPSRLTQSEPSIKDVCEQCNNEKLSDLDSYAEVFFRRVCTSPPQPNTLITELDFDQLSRWLIKISYNAARAEPRSPCDALRALRKFVIDKNNAIPRDLAIFVGVVKPVASNNDGKSVEMLPRAIAISPLQLKTGNKWFSVRRFVQLYKLFFVILKVKRRNLPVGLSLNQIFDAFGKQVSATRLAKNQSDYNLGYSIYDAKSIQAPHFAKNVGLYKEYNRRKNKL